MKLILQNNRIAATATDDYAGPDDFIDAPADFDIARINEYRIIDGELVIPPSRVLTKLQFMDRFTDEEMEAIYTAAEESVQVEIWLERFKLASEVDLDDPRTISGVQALESAGLIAEGRAAEILNLTQQGA